jgi:hypothetical protein
MFSSLFILAYLRGRSALVSDRYSSYGRRLDSSVASMCALGSVNVVLRVFVAPLLAGGQSSPSQVVIQAS